jgi:hypothetical protein
MRFLITSAIKSSCAMDVRWANVCAASSLSLQLQGRYGQQGNSWFSYELPVEE